MLGLRLSVAGIIEYDFGNWWQNPKFPANSRQHWTWSLNNEWFVRRCPEEANGLSSRNQARNDRERHWPAIINHEVAGQN